MAKTLIAYFSHAGENWVNGGIGTLKRGNNEVVVDKLRVLLPGIDVFRIEPAKRYPERYQALIDVAKDELRAKARPALAADVANPEQYSTIVLGYPNWWGTMPMCVFTFLEAHQWAGKTIAPFCTHEGSGFGSSLTDLKRACPGANIAQGLSLYGSNVASADKQIEGFIKTLTL